MNPADVLQTQLERTEQWPPKSEQHLWAKVRTRRAFRQADEVFLRELSGWHRTWGHKSRVYMTDPLAGLISRAFADLLFGDEPTIAAAAEQDQGNLDQAIETNTLASELHRAERICSSEGEVWWRVYVDKDVALSPLLQWCSRLSVIPLLHGATPTAVAFVNPLPGDSEIVWRHLEIHADGEVRNLLYEGTKDNLGGRRDLTARAETDGLPDVWVHDLPMLAGRILNLVDDDPTLGRSDYTGVERLLLALNEAATIGAENARLTAKKRLFVSGKMTEDDGSFDAGADVIQVNPQDGELGKDSPPPISAVEYSFDAAALIAYTSDLTDRVLTRVGVAPELVGRDTKTGRAESGTALRTRLLHSVITAQGKGRYWDDGLPRILALVQQIDALPAEEGGYGRSYVDPSGHPAVERGSILPHDDVEEAQRLVALVAGEVMSRELAVREQHPDWDDTQVGDELTLIDKYAPPIGAHLTAAGGNAV
jgi:hypothetical protein